MSAYRLRHRLRRMLLKALDRIEPLVGGEATTLVALGALIGLVTGGLAVVFVYLLRIIDGLVWDHSLPDLHRFSHESPLAVADVDTFTRFYPLVIVPVGMLLVVWFVRRFAPSAAGHGVPEVMEAVATRSGRISGRVGWVKLLASSANIGMGGSLGKEGPVVQVGSALGSVFGQFFSVKRTHMRTLVGCGAAAGIAAVFNAPIGGVLFALEIIIGTYSLSSFSPIVIASVVGAVTARSILGDQPAFFIPEALHDVLTVLTPWELGAYVVLGLGAGLLSVGFTRLLYGVEDLFDGWRTHWALRAGTAGLIVGGMGVYLPQILGEGHGTMSDLLLGTALPWTLLLTLALLKTLATAVTLGGGGSGGVFMPSLFVGAMVGAAFGQGMEALFPGAVAPTGAYALAGMAALLAGTAHAPLTGILLLFEMSDNYLLILPLMTASVLATMVSRGMLKDSVYTLKLSRRGIFVNERPDTALLRRLHVADAMRPPAETILESARFNEIVEHLLGSRQHDFPVVDADDHLMGALSLDDLREFIREEHLRQILVARDCVHPIDTLAPQSTLLAAFETFERDNVYEVPVISRGRVVGSLRRRDVLAAYGRALRS